MTIHWLDALLISFYFIGLVVVSLIKSDQKTDTDYLLSGRKLTLPAFIATLISTWYGGILGVGEFGFRFGISQWIVFGLPYYFFALLYALWLAKKIRAHPALSIPEAVRLTYGKKAGLLASLGVFLLVNPAPYILMIAYLAQFFLGSSYSILLLSTGVAIFSMLYVGKGGFSAVIRTDILQIILMYGGFASLAIYLFFELPPLDLWTSLPDLHREPLGGNSITYVLVWFFIAVWTFVDPGFHQRVVASKSGKVAQRGIILSIIGWAMFDFLTVLVALYGVVFLPDLEQPALIYPELAQQFLPSGVLGLFILGLLATIMSTLDSFLFLSGQTLGKDVLSYSFPSVTLRRLTQSGIVVAVILSILLILLLPNVIDLWYYIGSAVIPALLLPILGVYHEFFKMPNKLILLNFTLPPVVFISWILLEQCTLIPFYIEPFYPAMGTSLIFFFLSKTLPVSIKKNATPR